MSVFMDPLCVYSTKNPIYLTFFQSLFTNRASEFAFVNITLFFWQKLEKTEIQGPEKILGVPEPNKF